MRIIILGPPGTGKGTQARVLAKKLHLKHFNSGDFFRKEYAKKTVLGIKAYSYWGRGNLVPDGLKVKMLDKKLPKNNYILDGYPRTLSQARLLEKKQRTDNVIYISSSKKEIFERLLQRARIEGRSDDTAVIIKRRLVVYEKQTKPLLHFYRKKIIRVNGDQVPEKVLEEILKKLTKV